MNEYDAVKKALLLSGFINGGNSFFFEDTDKQVYIPAHCMFSFKDSIEYMQTYAFYRYCTIEERKVYYLTARKLEKLYAKFLSQQSLYF